MTYEIIEDFAKQNTRYLELRSTPKAFKGTTARQYIDAVVEVMEHCESEFPIKVRFIASFNRQSGVEAAMATLGLIDEIRSPYIVGVELSGDPRGDCKF